MIHKIPTSSGNIIGFNVSGKLSDDDYKNIVIPEVEQGIDKFGEINLLWEMEETRGWGLHTVQRSIRSQLKLRTNCGRQHLVLIREP